MEQSKRDNTLVAAFFLSGAAALTYEIVWSRLLQTVLGTTVHTASTILAAFLLGLSIGSFLLRNYHNSPGASLNVLSCMEFSIAAYGALMVVLLSLLPRAYSYLPGSLVVRVVISLILILPPTILLGGLWPLVNRMYISDATAIQAQSGTLYCANSLGSAFGALICGFVLVPLLGFRAASVTAILFNAAAGSVLFIAANKYADQ